MKKIFKSCVSILLIVLLMFTAVPLSFAADSNYYEDFEEFKLDTYTANADNYALKLGESDTGYCLNINVKQKGNSTSNVQYVEYKNLSMTGNVTVEFDFMTNVDFTFEAFFNGGKADVFNHLRDGRGSFAGDYSKGSRSPVWYDEKGGDNIVREGEWYHVTLSMDLNKSTYNYTINGKSGKNFDSEYKNVYKTIQLPKGCTALTGFGIVGLANNADVSIDNIEIYSGEKQSAATISNAGLAHKLKALNILDDMPDETGAVTKAEFVKMLVRAMGITPSEMNVGDEFSDMADHPDRLYLKYGIALGVINGKGDGTLGADDTINVGAASKIAVTALGYKEMAEEKGGYQVGYLLSAKSLGLLKSINEESDFTYADAMQMTWNFLKSSTIDNQGNKSAPIIYSRLGLTWLRGEVLNFDSHSSYVRLAVTHENEEEVTKTESFKIPKDYASMNWEGVVADVFMDEDYNVVYITPYGDSNSRYGYLYCINDKADISTINASDIREITLFDGTEYKVGNNLELYVNDLPVSSAVLTNAFVYMVLDDNNVVRINVIRDGVDPIYGNMLVEGGIINSTRSGEIRFTSGENNYGLIQDADDSGYTVVVNGVLGTVRQLKKGMLFDYKQNTDGSYYFSVSDALVSGVVGSLNSDYMQIGDTAYPLSNRSVYVMEAGEDFYRADYSLNSLLGLSVEASLDPMGSIRYIRITEDSREFYGIVSGAKKPQGLDDTRELLICTRKGEKIYPVSDKLDTSYGFVDFDTAASNARDVSGAGIYKFYTNLKGEITGIESISWINPAGTSISVVGDSTTIAKLGSYFADTQNIFSLTDINGDFAPQVVNWVGNLQGAKVHPTEGLKILFSQPVDDEFYSRIAVITKGFESLYDQGTDEFGFITNVIKILDENGDEGIKVVMADRRGNEYNFTVPSSRMYFNVNGSTETYKKNSYIHFMTPKNGMAVPIVMDYLDLSLPTSAWSSIGGKYATKLEHYGTFERIRNNEIYCRLDGVSKGMYMRPNTNVTGYCYDDKEGRYVSVPLTDIIGKDVWCITSSSYITAVICPE